MSPPPSRVVLTDANVLINLTHVSRLNLFGRIPGYEFVLPDHVLLEILQPEQRTAVEATIHAGHLRVEAIRELPVLIVFAELKERMGRGESACLAIAESR